VQLVYAQPVQLLRGPQQATRLFFSLLQLREPRYGETEKGLACAVVVPFALADLSWMGGSGIILSRSTPPWLPTPNFSLPATNYQAFRLQTTQIHPKQTFNQNHQTQSQNTTNQNQNPHLKHLLELAQALHRLHGVKPRDHRACRVPLVAERLRVRNKGVHLLQQLALEADLLDVGVG